MWYGYDELPVYMYLTAIVMTTMLALRLLPPNSKDTAYRYLVKDGMGVILSAAANSTHQSIQFGQHAITLLPRSE